MNLQKITFPLYVSKASVLRLPALYTWLDALVSVVKLAITHVTFQSQNYKQKEQTPSDQTSKYSNTNSVTVNKRKQSNRKQIL